MRSVQFPFYILASQYLQALSWRKEVCSILDGKDIFFVRDIRTEYDEDGEKCVTTSYSNGWTAFDPANAYFISIIKAIRAQYDYYDRVRSECLGDRYYEIRYKDRSEERYEIRTMRVHDSKEQEN